MAAAELGHLNASRQMLPALAGRLAKTAPQGIAHPDAVGWCWLPWLHDGHPRAAIAGSRKTGGQPSPRATARAALSSDPLEARSRELSRGRFRKGRKGRNCERCLVAECSNLAARGVMAQSDGEFVGRSDLHYLASAGSAGSEIASLTWGYDTGTKFTHEPNGQQMKQKAGPSKSNNVL